VYTCSSGGSGSQQREVADGADVVFTDTRNLQCSPDLLAGFEGAASQ